MAFDSRKALKEARDCLNAKEFERCVELCTQILQWDSSNYNALVFAGLAYQNLSKYEDSQTAYEAAIELDKENVLAWQGILNLYEKWNRPLLMVKPIELLMKSYFKSMERKKHLELNQRLVQIYSKSGMVTEAVGILQQLLEDSSLRQFYESDMPDEASTLLEICKLVERDEEFRLKKEVDARRFKLGAPPLKEIVNKVEAEIILSSKVPEYYDRFLAIGEDSTLIDEKTLCLARNGYIRYLYKKIPHIESKAEKEYCFKVMMKHCNAWREKIVYWDGMVAEIILQFTDLSENENYDEELVKLYLEKEKVEEGKETDRPFRLALDGYSKWLLSEYSECREILEAVFKVEKSNIICLRTLARLELLEESREACLSSNIKLLNLINRLHTRFSVDFSKSLRDCKLQMANAYFDIDVKYYANALELYLSLVKRNSNDIDALEGLTLVNGAMKKPKEALKYGYKVLELRPSSHKATSEISWQLFQIDSLNDALKYAKMALDLNQNQPEYHYRLGCIYWKMDGQFKSQPEYALNSFMSCVKLDLSHSNAFTKLGQYYKDVEGNEARALKCYEKAFSVDNSNEEAAFQLSVLKAKETNQVIAILEAHVSSNPRSAWGWKKLGFLQISQRQYEGSVTSFQTALRISSEDAHCWEGLGESYMKTGKYLAALKAFQKALDIDKDSHISLFHMSVCHRALGQFVESISTSELLLARKDEFMRVAVVQSLCDTLLQQCVEYKTQGYFGRASECCVKVIYRCLETLQDSSSSNGKLIAFWKTLSDAFVELFDLERFVTLLLDDEKMTDLWNRFSPLLDAVIQDEFKFETDQRLADDANATGINRMFVLACRCTKAALVSALSVSGSIAGTHVLWYQLSVLYHHRYLRKTDDKDLLSYAVKCVQVAIESISKSGNQSFIYWNSLGLYTLLMDPLFSQHCFIKAINLANGADGQPWVNLGFLYLRNDQVEMANKAFSNALASDPENLSAWMGQIVIAEHYDYKNFLALIDHAFDMSLGTNEEVNRLFSLHKFKIWIESKSKDSSHLAEIQFALEKYIELNESDPFAAFLLAIVMERLEKIEYAKLLIDKAHNLANERLMKVMKYPHLLSGSRSLLESIRKTRARVCFLIGEFEKVVEITSSVLSSNEVDKQDRQFEQLLLALSYYYVQKYDLSIGIANELFSDLNAHQVFRENAVLLICQCLFAQKKNEMIEKKLIEWRATYPESVRLLDFEVCYGILTQNKDHSESYSNLMKMENFSEAETRRRSGRIVSIALQLENIPKRSINFASNLVRLYPHCAFSWLNLISAILETNASLILSSKRSAESAIKLLISGDDNFDSQKDDLIHFYDLLCQSHMAGGTEAVSADGSIESALKDAQMSVRLNPSSLKARISLVMAYRVQINAKSISRGAMKRYKFLFDSMKKISASTGSALPENIKTLQDLLLIDLMYLNSLISEDVKRKRDHLLRAFKECDKILKGEGSKAPELMQGLIYWFMGRILLSLDQKEQALISYKNAIQFCPDHYLLWMEFSDILFELGLWKASEWIDSQLGKKEAPSKALSVVNQAKYVLKELEKGSFEQAREYQKRLLEELSSLEMSSCVTEKSHIHKMLEKLIKQDLVDFTRKKCIQVAAPPVESEDAENETQGAAAESTDQ